MLVRYTTCTKEGYKMLPSYQVEYQVNGIPRLFEFYLFVNPLGRKSYYAEQELNLAVERIAAKVDVHILTFHNQKIVTEFMEHMKAPANDLQTRNQIYRTVYQASLAYKAASMQGKRKGRIFLMKMQQQIQSDFDLFTKEFILDLVADVGLDVDIFKEDYKSDFVRKLYLNDQKIAVDMQVEHTPSLVIFENNIDGFVLDGPITQQNILSQLDDVMEEYCLEHNTDHKPHLAILRKH